MTAEAALARKNAVSFEAKKTGFGQAQDGWSLTLRIQDQDVPANVRDAKKGVRFMVVLVEIGDDEQPVRRELVAAFDGADKPARTPAQIAGYLCTLPSFHKFLQEKFWDQWVENTATPSSTDEEVAAEVVRDLCTVESRSEITKDNAEWSALRLAFMLWEKEAEVVPA